ncbi:F-box domain [Ostreococcus tauri]|uniref:F-box domain n=1 Tax=Ostreococcus tauri TaxID=70448 RepID=A0A090LZ49_OSTTA|nr:F-box domain [Ostreococcus tauri]CEF97206.1 F-box domain [Ostreococcus tauri]|eukprot:XP_003078274.2 F-box domain [Ostreococcus tauri]
MASDVRLRPRQPTASAQMFTRPWLALFDRRKPARELEIPEILAVLDDNTVAEIASRLGPRWFARLAVTCVSFRDFVRSREDVWRGFCVEAFAHRESAKDTHEICRKAYRGCWRTMFWDRLRVRTDGVYVSRNTYIKPGVKCDLTMRNAVASCHLVVWYRFFRFLGNGEFVCKTSPKKLSVEAKLLRDQGALARSNDVFHGGYTIDGDDRVHCEVLRYGANGSLSATHFWTRLRGNKPGASNRMDMVKIAMVDEDAKVPVPDEDEWLAMDDEEHIYRRNLGFTSHKFDGTAPARVTNRGMGTLVFVPWDEVGTHEINKGVEEMDFYCTG